MMDPVLRRIPLTVELRPARPDEADAYFELFRSPSVCRQMDLVPFGTLHDARAFLAVSERQRQDRKSLRYTLWADGTFAGTLCVYAIFWHQMRASVGYALREDLWSRGLMTKALGQLEVLAAQELGLHRLQATVLPGNEASRRLLLKNGYACEGLLHHYEIWPGKGFVDLELYAKLLPVPRHRACVAVLDGAREQILMVKHSHDGRTYWTLPGGGLEPGETFEQAAVREVREETGLEVELGAMIFDETYSPEGGPAVSRCFWGTPGPGQTVRLGHDPEEVGLGPSDRMLQDVAWLPLVDLGRDVQVSRVIAFLGRD